LDVLAGLRALAPIRCNAEIEDLPPPTPQGGSAVVSGDTVPIA